MAASEGAPGLAAGGAPRAPPDGLMEGVETFAEVAVTEEELALFTVRGAALTRETGLQGLAASSLQP